MEWKRCILNGLCVRAKGLNTLLNTVLNLNSYNAVISKQSSHDICCLVVKSDSILFGGCVSLNSELIIDVQIKVDNV
jgi:hypothetical protein